MLFKFAEMPLKCEGTYFLPFFLLLFLLKPSKGLHTPPQSEEHLVMMLEDRHCNILLLLLHLSSLHSILTWHLLLLLSSSSKLLSNRTVALGAHDSSSNWVVVFKSSSLVPIVAVGSCLLSVIECPELGFWVLHGNNIPHAAAHLSCKGVTVMASCFFVFFSSACFFQAFRIPFLQYFLHLT